MKYVLDASVAVAALRTSEPGHADAFERCMPLFTEHDEIVVPSIFDVEVTSALVRRGIAPARISAFFEQYFAARRLVTVGPRAARAVRAVVGVTQLRAADALYVWVAAREALPLVTADREVLSRAPLAGVTAIRP